MSSRPSDKSAATAGEKRHKDARAERLAAALRANLKRRKQQARNRALSEQPAAKLGEK